MQRSIKFNMVRYISRVEFTNLPCHKRQLKGLGGFVQAPPKTGKKWSVMLEGSGKVVEVKRSEMKILTYMEGWAGKEGGGTSLFGRKNWTKRYFVLMKEGDAFVICYFTDTPIGVDGIYKRKGCFKGKIVLSNMEKSTPQQPNPDKDQTDGNGFKVICKTRTYLMSTDEKYSAITTSDLAGQWIDTIRKLTGGSYVSDDQLFAMHELQGAISQKPLKKPRLRPVDIPEKPRTQTQLSEGDIVEVNSGPYKGRKGTIIDFVGEDIKFVKVKLDNKSKLVRLMESIVFCIRGGGDDDEKTQDPPQSPTRPVKPLKHEIRRFFARITNPEYRNTQEHHTGVEIRDEAHAFFFGFEKFGFDVSDVIQGIHDCAHTIGKVTPKNVPDVVWYTVDDPASGKAYYVKGKFTQWERPPYFPYDEPLPEDDVKSYMLQTLLYCLQHWLETYWMEDFSGHANVKYVCQVKEILTDIKEQSTLDLVHEYVARIESSTFKDQKMMESAGAAGVHISRPSLKPVLTSIKPKMSTLMEMITMTTGTKTVQQSPVHVAHQLTLRGSKLASRIRPREFLRPGKWGPNVLKMNEHFKFVVKVIQTLILSTEDKTDRLALIAWIFQIAEELKASKDYNTVQAVHTALSCTDIYRLNVMWDDVPEDLKQKREGLKQLFAATKNRKTLRQATKDSGEGPCMPCQYVLQSDLISLDEVLKLLDKPGDNKMPAAVKFSDRIARHMQYNANFPYKADIPYQQTLDALAKEVEGLDMTDCLQGLSDKRKKSDEKTSSSWSIW